MLAREIPRERLKFSRIREDGEQIDGFARRNVAILQCYICEILQGVRGRL